MRTSATSKRIGIFPGAFNPVTWGHLELARAAIEQYALGQVIFLLPTSLPHKNYVNARFEDRILFLQAALADDERYAIASSQQGLFCEIAAETRKSYPPGFDFFFLCGRDAAERIVNWDYGDTPSFKRQLEDFQLLVASRRGNYLSPPHLKERIHTIRMPAECDTISASAVRKAISQRKDWKRFVPLPVVHIILKKKIYN